MVRRSVWGLVACGSLVGCAAPPPTSYSVEIDPAWGEQTGEIVAALDDWTAHVGVTFRVQMSADWCGELPNTFVIRPVPHEDLWQYTPDRAAMGVTDRGGHWIVIEPNMADQGKFRATLRHELGHVMGLGHDADPSALMFHAWTGNTEITPRDEAAYFAR